MMQRFALHKTLKHCKIKSYTSSLTQQWKYYSLYAWGTSVHNSIPISNDSDASTLLSSSKTVYDHPQKLDMDFGDKITDFQCGKDKSAVILSNGECYTWGHNNQGQLGLDHNDTVTKPTLLEMSKSSPISDISLQTDFSACVSNGDLYTFGSNGSAFQGGMGFLGHGDENSYYTPKLVESLIEDGCTTSQVGVGNNHMVVLTTEGEVLTAGSGSYGRLGNLEPLDQLFLEPVELLAGEDICQISVGNAFSLALTRDGIIHAWGRNDKGQLGDGGGLMVDMYAMESLPVSIQGQLEGRVVEKISAGYAHAACITDKGELFFWGMGQSLEPTLMTSMLDKQVIQNWCY